MGIDLRNIGSIYPNGTGTITIPGNVNITGTPAPQYMINGVPLDFVSAGGSYSDPSWITSLAWSKITGAPAFLTSAVLSLSPGSLTGNVILAGGTNVTLSQTGQTITINASGGAAATPPAGAVNQIQWNAGGTPNVFGASANLIWLNATSRLGIGVAAPGYPLDVLGDMNIQSAASGQPTYRINGTPIISRVGTTNTFALTNIATINGAAPGGGGASQWQDGAAGAIYYTGGSVGIGTATPQSNFQVRVAANQNFQVLNSWSAPGFTMMQAVNDANSAVVSLQLNGPILALTGGNVGIGRTAPISNLDVLGFVRIENDAVTWPSVAGLGLVAKAADYAWIGHAAFNPAVYYPLEITGNPLSLNGWRPEAYVGVAVQTPQRTLDVGNTGILVRSSSGIEIQASIPMLTLHNPGNSIFSLSNEGNIFRISSNVASNLITVGYAGNVGINTASPFARFDCGTDVFPIKIASYGDASGAYGIGVQAGTLTFGAQINAWSGTPQMGLNSQGVLSCVNGANPFDPGIPRLQVQGGICVNGMAVNGLASLRIVSNDQAWGLGWHTPNEQFYLFTTAAWDAYGGWAYFPLIINAQNQSIDIRGNILFNGVAPQLMGTHWTPWNAQILFWNAGAGAYQDLPVAWKYGWYRVQGQLCFINVSFQFAQDMASVQYRIMLPLMAIAQFSTGSVQGGNTTSPAFTITNATVQGATNIFGWAATSLAQNNGSIWIATCIYQVA